MRFPKAYYDREEKARLLTASTKIVGFAPASAEDKPFDAEKEPDLASKLDFETWLPFAAKAYHISPRIESYVIKAMPVCPSDFPNRNGIGFPLQELVRFQPPPMNRQVYKAWAGCPIHLEHDNEDPTKAYGVMFDTALTKITGFGGGKHWKVMGLVGVDKDKHPDIAQELLDNKINTGSMGAMADSFTCSVCGRPASDNSLLNCSHVGSTREVNWNVVDYMGQQHVAYLNAHGLSPIEYSIVRDPAWVSAMSDHILKW